MNNTVPVSKARLEAPEQVAKYEEALKHCDERMAALPKFTKPTCPEAALTALSFWFQALYGEDDNVARDLSDMSVAVAALRATADAHERVMTEVKKMAGKDFNIDSTHVIDNSRISFARHLLTVAEGGQG